jgi:transcriptional regulator with XRE-family HTH domain
MNIDSVKKNSAEQLPPKEEWTFGSRLSILINKLGLTKKDFAEKVGVAPQTITNYCKNAHGPKHKFVDFVVDHFQVNRDWLTKGTGCIFSWQDAQLKAGVDQNNGCGLEFSQLQRELAAKDRELAAAELAMSRQQGRIYDSVCNTCIHLGLSPEQTRQLQFAVTNFEDVLSAGQNPHQSAAGNE